MTETNEPLPRASASFDGSREAQQAANHTGALRLADAVADAEANAARRRALASEPPAEAGKPDPKPAAAKRRTRKKKTDETPPPLESLAESFRLPEADEEKRAGSEVADALADASKPEEPPTDPTPEAPGEAPEAAFAKLDGKRLRVPKKAARFENLPPADPGKAYDEEPARTTARALDRTRRERVLEAEREALRQADAHAAEARYEALMTERARAEAMGKFGVLEGGPEAPDLTPPAKEPNHPVVDYIDEVRASRDALFPAERLHWTQKGAEAAARHVERLDALEGSTAAAADAELCAEIEMLELELARFDAADLDSPERAQLERELALACREDERRSRARAEARRRRAVELEEGIPLDSGSKGRFPHPSAFLQGAAKLLERAASLGILLPAAVAFGTSALMMRLAPDPAPFALVDRAAVEAAAADARLAALRPGEPESAETARWTKASIDDALERAAERLGLPVIDRRFAAGRSLESIPDATAAVFEILELKPLTKAEREAAIERSMAALRAEGEGRRTTR